MKKLSTFLLFLFFNVAVIAQPSFGVKINGGVSRISDNSFNPVFSTQKTYFMPSGQAGLFFSLPIRTHEVFGVELLFSQITGKEAETDTVGTFSSNGITNKLFSTSTISRNISYLSLPIYYGVKIKKFTVKVGLQVSIALIGRGHTEMESNFYPKNYYLTLYQNPKLYIKDAAFGETASITYNLSPKFAIEANYYYELSNLYRNAKLNGSTQTVWKYQQITLGLRYAFLNLKKKEAAK
ncbi:MAG TPA: porin family protein [Bacteroidia bacterium]|jgi:hypothetical protein|nr:porin family protein [Bacteroidia bacterium]